MEGLWLGKEVEGIRNEEGQKDVQDLHDVYKICPACRLISAKRLPGLLPSPGRLLIHDMLQFPKLLHKRLTASGFDYLETKFSSKHAIKI